MRCSMHTHLDIQTQIQTPHVGTQKQYVNLTNKIEKQSTHLTNKFQEQLAQQLATI